MKTQLKKEQRLNDEIEKIEKLYNKYRLEWRQTGLNRDKYDYYEGVVEGLKVAKAIMEGRLS
jgi:hypothetical protein